MQKIETVAGSFNGPLEQKKMPTNIRRHLVSEFLRELYNRSNR